MIKKCLQKSIIDLTIPCFPKPSKIRITDLKIGCLVKIFRHLRLMDLLNLADSNVYLKRAAECVYVERYGNKKVWLYKVRAYESRHYSTYTNILVEDFKTSLQLLRLFGHLISRLEIGEGDDSSELCLLHRTMYKYIFGYVNEYCSMYVTDITFVMIPKGAMEILKRPFYQARTVNIFGCHFGKMMTSFELLFPNVLCMKLDYNNAIEPKIIEEHWRRMKHLEVSIDHTNFKRENIEELLCLNPQLRRLKIGYGWSADFLEDISIFLQFIEILEFGRLFEGFSDYTGKPIHFEGVKKLKLSLFNTKNNNFPKIPLSFVQLDELTLETNHELGEEFFKFMGENKTISKLNIPATMEKIEIKGDQFKFRKEIAFLTEINLSRYTFSTEHIVELLHDFTFVTKFTFKLDSHEQLNDLVYHLKDDWVIKETTSLIGKIKCIEFNRLPVESSFQYIRQFLSL